MNTFSSTQTRRLFFVAVLAAFAAQAEASGTTSKSVDTQTKVGAVLAGARADVNVTVPSTSGVHSQVADVHNSTQQILLGINSSKAGVRYSIGNNGQSTTEVQKLTQAVVLGRAAS
jgi:hypothetical protein